MRLLEEMGLGVLLDQGTCTCQEAFISSGFPPENCWRGRPGPPVWKAQDSGRIASSFQKLRPARSHTPGPDLRAPAPSSHRIPELLRPSASPTGPDSHPLSPLDTRSSRAGSQDLRPGWGGGAGWGGGRGGVDAGGVWSRGKGMAAVFLEAQPLFSNSAKTKNKKRRHFRVSSFSLMGRRHPARGLRCALLPRRRG